MEVPHALGDVDANEFRAHAQRVIEWVAEYLRDSERFSVLSQVEPGDVRCRLPTDAPLNGQTLDATLNEFGDVILLGITHWNHPSFFAYFAICGSAPGILGELLAAALNVNGMV